MLYSLASVMLCWSIPKDSGNEMQFTIIVPFENSYLLFNMCMYNNNMKPVQKCTGFIFCTFHTAAHLLIAFLVRLVTSEGSKGHQGLKLRFQSKTKRLVPVNIFVCTLNKWLCSFKCDFQQCGILTCVDSDGPV